MAKAECAFKDLLTYVEDGKEVDLLLPPEEVQKLMRQLRGVRIMVWVDMPLYTSEDRSRAYDLHELMETSAAKIIKMAENQKAFNSRKQELDKNVGFMRVERKGNCIFVGH